VNDPKPNRLQFGPSDLQVTLTTSPRNSSSPRRPTSFGAADITYLRTCEGGGFPAVVQDAFSRRIVGSAMNTVVTEAVDMVQRYVDSGDAQM
jgi:transposase InsO family protein